jgi:hypothetical protein
MNRLLTLHEQALVDALTDADVASIDAALLENVGSQWRKVAMVVGTTMMSIERRIRGLPDVYYAQRVAMLVNRGYLESQGDVSRMRFSEVRISS